jgi:diadenylate cyclase
LEIIYALSNIDLRAIVDILLVALLFFGVSFFIRGTQAMTLLRGVLVLLGIVVIVTSVLQLTALQWLLQNILTFAAVAIPVIFQPELRRALERLGRAGFFAARQAPDDVRLKIIDDICQAAERLSERRHGALIVLERNSSLQEYIRTGVSLNSDVSPQLLLTIFWPKTELHDGAAIINNEGRVASAASVLPLSSARTMTTPKLGTRHRAAIGMSEVSDAVCVVVSEETGRISIANGGRLIARLDVKRLRTILNAFYGPEQARSQSLRQRLRDGLELLASRVREQRKQA